MKILLKTLQVLVKLEIVLKIMKILISLFLMKLPSFKNYNSFTFIEMFYPYLRYEFIKNSKNLSSIQDMEIGFENRLYENALKYTNYQEFYSSIINKRYTLGRTQRVLIHSLLNLTKDITEQVKQEIPYVKIMGFSPKGREYLTYLKNSTIKNNHFL